MKIIPYSEEILKTGGAFVKPDGELVLTSLNTEGFAKSYCEGDYYEVLQKMKAGDNNFYLSFKEIAGLFAYDLEYIDEYLSSSLTKDDLELFKKWLLLNQDKVGYLRDSIYSDFLIQVLGWDKLETVLKKRITTTSFTPYTKYWNYLLEDFELKRVVPKKFNSRQGSFEPFIESDSLRELQMDELVKRENETIKKKCLTLPDRRRFYR